MVFDDVIMPSANPSGAGLEYVRHSKLVITVPADVLGPNRAGPLVGISLVHEYLEFVSVDQTTFAKWPAKYPGISGEREREI